MQEKIDSAHFAELLAEETINPRGEWRADFRAGIIASTIANYSMGHQGEAEPAGNFMPDFRTLDEIIIEEQEALMRKRLPDGHY